MTCSCVARLAGIPLLGTRAMTALQRACINGATGLVKILVDAGADCNIIGTRLIVMYEHVVDSKYNHVRCAFHSGWQGPHRAAPDHPPPQAKHGCLFARD